MWEEMKHRYATKETNNSGPPAASRDLTAPHCRSGQRRAQYTTLSILNLFNFEHCCEINFRRQTPSIGAIRVLDGTSERGGQNRPSFCRGITHQVAMKITAKQALAVRCPTCGAEPGKKCELSTGQPRTNPHRDRRWVASDV